MSRYSHSDAPGQVVMLPAKPGRRTHFGALAALDGGKLMVCIGYTADGRSAAYVPMLQLESLKGTYRRASRKPMYRLLKRIIAHYEVA